VHGAAHAPPPTTDALDGKSRRVVIDPHADPRRILGQIVDPIRTDAAQFADEEVVYQDLLRLAFGTQFAADVLERTKQLHLVGRRETTWHRATSRNWPTNWSPTTRCSPHCSDARSSASGPSSISRASCWTWSASRWSRWRWRWRAATSKPCSSSSVWVPGTTT